MATANRPEQSLWCHACSRLHRHPGDQLDEAAASNGSARCGHPAAALEPVVDVVDSRAFLYSCDPDPNTRLRVTKQQQLELLLLPTVTVRDAGRDCAVCMDPLNPGAPALVTPCAHAYHPCCVVPWLEAKGTCPLCRARVGGGGDRDGLVLCHFNHRGRLGLGRRIAGCIFNIKVLDADGKIYRPRVRPGLNGMLRGARMSAGARLRRDRGGLGR